MAKKMGGNSWREIEVPDMIGIKVFRKNRLQAFVSIDAGRLHMSISHRQRYPTWDEIKDARYALLPHDITMAQFLPPPSRYINVHPNCFHLWEVEDPMLDIITAG